MRVCVILFRQDTLSALVLCVCVFVRHVIINSSNDEENKKKCNLEERKKNPEINVYKGINICVVVVVTSRAFCVSHVCQS